MKRFEVTMGWSTIDILLLRMALISQIAIVRHVCMKEGTLRLLPPLAELTREERGRGGVWFWAFGFSLFMLFYLAHHRDGATARYPRPAALVTTLRH